MAAKILPVVNTKALDQLELYYKAAKRKIENEILTATDFGRANRLSILKQIDAELAKLADNTQTWTNTHIVQSYIDGGVTAAHLLAQVGDKSKPLFSLIDKEAAQAMADSTFQDFGTAITLYDKSAGALMSEAQKMQINGILAEGKVSGDTAQAISDRVAGLISKGALGMTDKSGKTWDIQVYSRMLARTKLADATNTGLVNQLTQRGYDLVKVSQHSATDPKHPCPYCTPYNGAILSISGNDNRYPSLQQAKDDGLFHPNCEHRVYPYSEDFNAAADKWASQEDASDENL